MGSKIPLGKRPTLKALADELGVSEQAVKQYPKRKKELMVRGLWFEQLLKSGTIGHPKKKIA